jgi:hypothetical protein
MPTGEVPDADAAYVSSFPRASLSFSFSHQHELPLCVAEKSANGQFVSCLYRAIGAPSSIGSTIETIPAYLGHISTPFWSNGVEISGF